MTGPVLSIPSIGSSNSLSSILTVSAAHICAVGCQTMRILSSEVLLAVHASASPGAQQKSVGRAVCPNMRYQQPSSLCGGCQRHTSVHEHEFWRPVFLLIGCLLDTDLRQVPYVDPAVAGSGRENGIIVR